MDPVTPNTNGCASLSNREEDGAAWAQLERARKLQKLAGTMARNTTGMERVRCLLDAIVCWHNGKFKGQTDMTKDALLWSPAQEIIVCVSRTAADLKDTLDRCEGHMQKFNFFHAYMVGFTTSAGHIDDSDLASHDEVGELIDEFFPDST